MKHPDMHKSHVCQTHNPQQGLSGDGEVYLEKNDELNEMSRSVQKSCLPIHHPTFQEYGGLIPQNCLLKIEWNFQICTEIFFLTLHPNWNGCGVKVNSPQIVFEQKIQICTENSFTKYHPSWGQSGDQFTVVC